MGARTVTIGAFRLRNGTHGGSGGGAVDVVALNTHLDVWSAPARLAQARSLRGIAQEWAARHPAATLVVTGDFNAAPGHAPHRELLAGGLLRDTWDECAVDRGGGCASHDMAATFHGWLGASVTNAWAVRVAQYAAQVLHGMGLEMPRSLDAVSLARVARLAWHALSQLSPRAVWDALPASLNRLHVDWVLASPPAAPVMAFVGDARDSELSSDHFPVVVLLRRRWRAAVARDS